MNKRWWERCGRALAVLGVSCFALGANRYVAPTGTDGGDCTNASAPCRTLQFATNRAICGDVVIAEDGVYSAGVTIPISCSATAPLVVKSRNRWGAVLRVSSGSNAVIYSVNRSQITVDGFSIERSSGAPIAVRFTGGTGIRLLNIRDQYPCGLADSMYVENATDVTIDGCDVGQNVSNDECTYSNGGCYPTNNVVNLTMRNSVCHDVRNFGNQKNIRNAMYDGLELRNMHNHGISLYDSSDVTIQRSILWHTPGNTVTDIGSLADTYCSQRVNIRNNTSRGSSSKITQFYYSFSPVPSECSDGVGNDFSINNDVRVYNNIIYGTKADCLQPGLNMPAGAFSSNYNIFHECGEEVVNQYSTLPAWQSAGESWARVKDPNSLVTRPTFMNEAAGDFRAASAASPQVDAGDNTNCAHTIVNGRCDIGAFEYGGGGGGTAPGAVQNLYRVDQRQR